MCRCHALQRGRGRREPRAGRGADLAAQDALRSKVGAEALEVGLRQPAHEGRGSAKPLWTGNCGQGAGRWGVGGTASTRRSSCMVIASAKEATISAGAMNERRGMTCSVDASVASSDRSPSTSRFTCGCSTLIATSRVPTSCARTASGRERRCLQGRLTAHSDSGAAPSPHPGSSTPAPGRRPAGAACSPACPAAPASAAASASD